MYNSLWSNEFKEALRRSIVNSGLTYDAAAERAHISKSTLAQACDERVSGGFLSVPRLVALLPALRSDPAVVQFLASLVGCVVSRVPDPAQPVRSMAEVMREFARFCEVHCTAVDDGKWTAGEAEDVAREGEQVMALIAGVVEAAKRASQPALRAVGGGK